MYCRQFDVKFGCASCHCTAKPPVFCNDAKRIIIEENKKDKFEKI